MVQKIIDQWMIEHATMVVAAFPGRSWCLHLTLDVQTIVLDGWHDNTQRKDMARWN